jgi:nucleotide-binding universal stress UspA family protein
MRTILIPTDFSESAENSVLFSIKLAEKLGLKVILLHVIELYKYASGTSDAEILTTLPEKDVQYIENKVNETFDKHISNIKEKYRFILPLEKKISSGHLLNELINEISSGDIEYLVMALSENRDIEFFLNNNSSILNEVICPVLIIPPKTTFVFPEKILFVIDFRKPDLTSVINLIHNFTKYQPEIVLVYLSNKPGSFDEELMREGFKQMIIDNTAYSKISIQPCTEKELKKITVKYSKDEQLSLIAMSKKAAIESRRAKKIAVMLNLPLLICTDNK